MSRKQQSASSSSLAQDIIGGGSSGTVRFVDGSWFHKGPRNGRAEFQQGPRIPGAVYFDLDDISCSTTLFPQWNPHHLSHMQPPPQLFAAYMDHAGHKSITNEDVVIVYGQAGCAFLPRVWFTFRHVMGHERVYLMQASLQEWMEHGGPIEENHNNDSNNGGKPHMVWAKDLDWSAPTRYQVSNYYQLRHAAEHSKNQPPLIVDRHDVQAMVTKCTTRILDPRGSSFVQHGHMPGAIHVPYTSLSEPDNPNRLLSVSALREVLRDVVVQNPPPETIVLSCGSGVSVCNLYLALEECGYTDRVNTVVYDGSWEEWRKYEDLPKILPTPVKSAPPPLS